MMDNERKNLTKKLNQELNDLHFSSQQNVFDKIYKKTWKQQIVSLWNKEIELSFLPITVVTISLIFLFFSTNLIISDNSLSVKKEKILIEVGGNIYWKDEIAKVESQYEN